MCLASPEETQVYPSQGSPYYPPSSEVQSFYSQPHYSQCKAPCLTYACIPMFSSLQHHGLYLCLILLMSLVLWTQYLSPFNGAELCCFPSNIPPLYHPHPSFDLKLSHYQHIFFQPDKIQLVCYAEKPCKSVTEGFD